MRLRCVLAKALFQIFLVFGVVAVKEVDLAVVLEGQDVSRDPVQEPAVVAYDKHCACKVLESVFEGAHGVHVDVVGGFVEKQDISAGFEHAGKMQAAALAAREHVHLLLLIRAAEVEAAAVGPGVDLDVAQGDGVTALADELVHGLARSQGGPALVHVGKGDRIPHYDLAGIGLFLAHKHAEEGGLACAVGADDAHYGACGDDGVQVFDEQLVAHALGYVLKGDDGLAKARSRGNVDLQILCPAGALVGKHGLVGIDAGLALGVTALGGHAYPLEFVGQGLLALGLDLFFLGQALFLLFEPGGVVALPGNAAAPVEFEDPACHVVQEVAVVGHGYDSAGEGVQIVFQPLHGLGVQMVCGFVKEQDVRGSEQQAAQGHAAPFATGNLRDGHVRIGAAQGVHGHFHPGVQIPDVLCIHLFLDLCLALDESVHGIVVHGFRKLCVDLLELLGNGLEGGNTVFHNLAHCAGLVAQRLLLKVANGVARGQHCLAVKGIVHAGKDFQKRGLACAVEAKHADLGAVEVGEADVLEDFLLSMTLAHAYHGVDNLVRFVVVAQNNLRIYGLKCPGAGLAKASVWCIVSSIGFWGSVAGRSRSLNGPCLSENACHFQPGPATFR